VEYAHITVVATFIPTERVLTGLMQAGFVPVEARQNRAKHSVEHARRLVRLRCRFECRFETVQLKDSVPEVVFLNSHDGTSAYLMLILICHHQCGLAQNGAHQRPRGRLTAMVTVTRV
jgi:hypothetical protein